MFLLNNESVLKPLENIITSQWDYFSFKKIWKSKHGQECSHRH